MTANTNKKVDPFTIVGDVTIKSTLPENAYTSTSTEMQKTKVMAELSCGRVTTPAIDLSAVGLLTIGATTNNKFGPFTTTNNKFDPFTITNNKFGPLTTAGTVTIKHTLDENASIETPTTLLPSSPCIIVSIHPNETVKINDKANHSWDIKDNTKITIDVEETNNQGMILDKSIIKFFVSPPKHTNVNQIETQDETQESLSENKVILKEAACIEIKDDSQPQSQGQIMVGSITGNITIAPHAAITIPSKGQTSLNEALSIDSSSTLGCLKISAASDDSMSIPQNGPIHNVEKVTYSRKIKTNTKITTTVDKINDQGLSFDTVITTQHFVPELLDIGLSGVSAIPETHTDE